ncbi:MAG: flagellar biosynthesis protein, partial [Microbacterium sp.]
MPSGLSLGPKFRYLAERARRIDIASVIERAKDVHRDHGKATPAVVADMLWSAARRDVAFQDYVDYDFAILSKAERATYMTHPVSMQLAQRY